MRVAVTTPTGHIGKVVTKHLLDAGEQVTLLARYPQKVREFSDRGAIVAQGAQDDMEFVIRATRGVDALFWLTPLDFSSRDFRGHFNRMGRAAAAAVRANRIPRVVHLSGAGAHLASGPGPIPGLHDIERRLDDVVTHVTHLRPFFFFENFLLQIESIKRLGRIFLPVSGSTRIAMLATGDIGQAAVSRLLDRNWSGRIVQGLHGPADLSFDEAAGAIGRGLDRPVFHVQVSEDQARRAMLAAGLNAHLAEAFLEIFEAIESGLLRPAELRTTDTTTSTTLELFSRDVLKPLVSEAAMAC